MSIKRVIIIANELSQYITNHYSIMTNSRTASKVNSKQEWKPLETSYPSDKQWVKYALLGKGKYGFLNMYADTDKSVHLFLSLVSELRSMAKLDSTVPSVSGHCWLRVRNGIRPTKNLPPANLRGSSL